MPDNSPPSRTIIDARFGQIWPVHVEGFTQLLILLRQQFDGDLDMLLVMAVIGEATLPKHLLPDGFDYSAQLAGQGEQIGKRPINTQSIADFSGIPRETVRRKLQVLVQKGWIERNKTGEWIATRTASKELQPATEATLEYLAKLREVLIAPD
jgi:predicted transcriptional regulator